MPEIFDLALTIAIFIIAHMLPAIAPLRRGLISVVGKAPYIVGFSMMSLGLLGWVGVAYVNAPYIELWLLPSFALWLPVLLMPLASILLVAVFTNPNPLSVALKSDGFNPARPGVVGITRHPLLAALLLWSGAHLIINGDLAALLLFGFFTIMPLTGPFSIEGRKKQKLGADEWARLSGPTSLVPFWAIIKGRKGSAGLAASIASIGWGTVVLGLALYGAVLFFHADVIGVVPYP